MLLGLLQLGRALYRDCAGEVRSLRPSLDCILTQVWLETCFLNEVYLLFELYFLYAIFFVVFWLISTSCSCIFCIAWCLSHFNFIRTNSICNFFFVFKAACELSLRVTIGDLKLVPVAVYFSAMPIHIKPILLY